MNRKLIILPLALTLLSLGANTALAVTHTGTIERLHYNSTIPGREACVRTIPTAPGTGWLCLYEQHLSNQINDLMLKAYENGNTCRFVWFDIDTSGHAILELVECFNF